MTDFDPLDLALDIPRTLACVASSNRVRHVRVADMRWAIKTHRQALAYAGHLGLSADAVLTVVDGNPVEGGRYQNKRENSHSTLLVIQGSKGWLRRSHYPIAGIYGIPYNTICQAPWRMTAASWVCAQPAADEDHTHQLVMKSREYEYDGFSYRYFSGPTAQNAAFVAFQKLPWKVQKAGLTRALMLAEKAS